MRRRGGLGEVWWRIRRRPVRNLSLLAALVTVVVVLGITVSRLSPVPLRQASAPALTLADALEALDQRQWQRAREIATALRLDSDDGPSRDGGTAYVLGTVMAHDAGLKQSPGEQQVTYLLAARYLEEAVAQGVPKGREAQSDYLLGFCLLRSGHARESVEAIRRAMKTNPDKKHELYELLVEAHIHSEPPRWAEALEVIGEYLNLADLAAERRQEALIQKARLHFQLDQEQPCWETLRQIPADSPHHAEALLMEARLLLREGDRRLAKQPEAAEQNGGLAEYEKAAELLQGILAENTLKDDHKRLAYYLLGRCHRRQGQLREALRAFVLAAQGELHSPEAVAAGLEEAEVYAELGNKKKSLESYRRVLGQVAEAVPFRNPLMTWEEFQRRIERAYFELLKASDFERAIELSTALTRAFPEDRALQLQAQVEQRWAEHLTEQMEQAPREQRRDLSDQAKAAWRHAGRLYRELARAHFTSRNYPDDLWISAYCLLQGQDYEQAVQLLRIYLANESRRDRARALAILGEAMLALNRPEDALHPLNECITFHPDDPFTYRARITAAAAHLELGRRDEAEKLLRVNLEQSALTPRSVEWRSSLYSLGKLLYEHGLDYQTQARLNGLNSPVPTTRKKAIQLLEKANESFENALLRLSEAVLRDEAEQRDRYARETLEARYRMAEAQRRSALLPLTLLNTVTIETTRVNLNREIRAYLSAAADAYSQLQKLLNEKQESRGLDETEKGILRNCYFARADAFYDMGDYEEAVLAYSDATNRYQHEPDCLEAYVQIANCYRMMNRPEEARGTLEQAKLVLQRIEPKADFTRTTRYDREQWTDFLNWLSAL